MNKDTETQLKELLEKIILESNIKTKTELFDKIKKIYEIIRKGQKYSSIPRKFGTGGMSHNAFFEAAYLHWLINSFEISKSTLKTENDKNFIDAVKYVLSKGWYKSLANLNNRITIYHFLPYILKTKRGLPLYTDYFFIVSPLLMGGSSFISRWKWQSKIYVPGNREKILKLLKQRKILKDDNTLNFSFLLKIANKRLNILKNEIARLEKNYK